MRIFFLTLLLAAFWKPILAQPRPRAVPHSADAADVRRADQRIVDALEEDAFESPSKVVVVYFTPKDRMPAAGHTERIRRIVQATATFYEDELARHGFSGRTLNLHRGADQTIAIMDIVGQDIDENYGKSSGRRVRNEATGVLRAAEIDPDESVLLIFCNMMDYDA
jgi:hypothetical protein